MWNSVSRTEKARVVMMAKGDSGYDFLTDDIL